MAPGSLLIPLFILFPFFFCFRSIRACLLTRFLASSIVGLLPLVVYPRWNQEMFPERNRDFAQLS